ncbi:hypothetical protein Q7P37_009043 [Cladosporium fusiforme]
MSTDPAAHEQDGQNGGLAPGTYKKEDYDTTPRSELPSTAAEPTSSASNSLTDYFAHHPPSSEAGRQPVSSSLPNSVASSRRSSPINFGYAQSPGKGPVPKVAVVSPFSDRPAPQREPSTLTALSMDSTDSTATLKPASSAPPGARPRPHYPNQSFSALQGFQYPHRGHPPTLRQRTSHPSQILTFSSAIASLHQSGSRTVGNSPAATPGHGLFTPNTEPPTHEDWESPATPGTYASPFLHFTHRQAPKETHVADVDVDPISGRKLINHYEIVDELGRGTHGKVKLGRDLQTADSHVAIKIVERYSKRRRLGKLGNAEDKVKKEVAILKKARHPNVVALLEVIDDPSRKKVYIVLEWVERGEIQWRTKAPKEIAVVEARRYEREKREKPDPQWDAEDDAVQVEAQRRLRRQKRALIRAARRVRQEASMNPNTWSHEMGDDESDDSDDDRLSRVSTQTADSLPSEINIAKLMAAAGRRISRTASPLPTSTLQTIPQKQEATSFLTLTEERPYEEPDMMLSSSPVEMQDSISHKSLDGTMYGAYDFSSGETSRVPSVSHSLHSSANPSRNNTGDLAQIATEVLESDLNPELEFVPCMTMQNVRVAFRDTLLGLQYLHYQGIVHRDIKPPNLLQTIDHRVKISDFGVSYLGRPLHDEEAPEELSENEARDLDDEAKELAKTVGTPAFFAPELCITDIMDDPPPVTKAIDVWALGITLFCMLYARTPYVDNEFVVMRLIADEEIYIPRKRLLPINTKPQSRPSSHGRVFPPTVTGKRHELDLIYEEVDDDLHDLLKRLLTKDPRKRITLEEVRHHPWVLSDLPNPASWLEETDTNSQSDGKKIEVSNEDVNTAVVPLQWVERVRSGIKRVGERLGFGSVLQGRSRSGSNAGVPGAHSGPPSASSSSSTISQDARRHSLRGDESIFSALKASREGEHPLSRSVTASPETERHGGFFDSAVPRPESVAAVLNHPQATSSPARPSPPERSKTITSTSGSVRTVKQADIHRVMSRESRDSPPPSPGLPSTPMALDSPGGSNLGGLLGGAGRRILKTVRERSAARSHPAEPRGRSAHRNELTESLDPHTAPTVAVSNTSASGHVDLPEALRQITPCTSANNSVRGSPASSRAHSVVSTSPVHLRPSMGPLSRVSSNSSMRSIARSSASHHTNEETPVKQAPKFIAVESSAEEWRRADDERVRKLIRQGEDEEQSNTDGDSKTTRPSRRCPSSPDDKGFEPIAWCRPSAADTSHAVSSYETSPTGHTGQLPPSVVSSSSDFGSAVSMSVSNPSIPSVISEASSIDPAEGTTVEELDGKNSGSTLNGTVATGKPTFRAELIEDEEGYSPDHEEQALDSDNEDEYDTESSSDSDGGLVMRRRRSGGNNKLHHSNSSSSPRNGSSLAAALEAAHAKQRRGTGLSRGSKRSSRSGSNNTMKKVRTRDSEDERTRENIQEE